MIKSRKMRWAGHVARIGGIRNALTVLLENLKRKHHFEDQDADLKIILKWMLER
jgi:hypothetical protein